MMRNYNFDGDLIQVIQALYANSNSAVLLNSQLGELFRTTVGAHSRLFSSTYSSRTLCRKPSKTIGGRPICSPRFADGIDLMGGSESELQDLTEDYH